MEKKTTFWRRYRGRLLILPPIALGVIALVVMVRQRQAPQRRQVEEAARVLRVIETPLSTIVPQPRQRGGYKS